MPRQRRVEFDVDDAQRLTLLLHDAAVHYGKLSRGEPVEPFDGGTDNARDWSEFCSRMAGVVEKAGEEGWR